MTTPRQPDRTPAEVDVDELADSLRFSVAALQRQLRQVDDGALPQPQVAALSLLEESGPMTSAALARAQQISAQSMGATLKALEARGLTTRTADPSDGRRILVSASTAGHDALRHRRQIKIDNLVQSLVAEFSATELAALGSAAELMRRLAGRISAVARTLDAG